MGSVLEYLFFYSGLEHIVLYLLIAHVIVCDIAIVSLCRKVKELTSDMNSHLYRINYAIIENKKTSDN